MDRRWIPVVARVEWRSEHADASRPAALRIGGARVVLAVVESSVEGPPTAGGPLARVFVAAGDDGRTYRIRRAGGRDRVEVAGPVC